MSAAGALRPTFHTWLALTAVACISVVAIPDAWLPARILATALLVLVLPGLAAANALLPRTYNGWAERTAISLGLSLAISVAAGLALNWLPGGLDRTSWACALGAVIGVCTVIAARREPFVPFAPPASALAIPLVIFALGAASVLAYASRDQRSAPTRDATALSLILRPTTSSQEAVLTLIQDRSRAGTYVVRIRSGGTVMGRWAVRLPARGRWEERVRLDKRLADVGLQADLLDAAQHRVLRRVRLRGAIR